MQVDDGTFRMLNDEQVKKFEHFVNQGGSENSIPLVRVGDTFKIRDCHFEVTELNEGGIVAKGIKRGDFIDKHFMR